MRKTRRDWLDAGLGLLGAEGAAALTIERLTTLLALTKGSFYHHFKSFDAYKTLLLEAFEKRETLAVIALTERQGDARQKLRFLLDLIVTGPYDVDVAVRAWAMQDDQARTVVARVDAARIEYVRTLCEPLAPTPAQAQTMAQLAYAILVGGALIQPPYPPATLRRLYDEFLRIYAL